MPDSVKQMWITLIEDYCDCHIWQMPKDKWPLITGLNFSGVGLGRFFCAKPFASGQTACYLCSLVCTCNSGIFQLHQKEFPSKS